MSQSPQQSVPGKAKSDGTCYVYVLFRPWSGIPFYVGKGRKKRLSVHARMGEKHPNPHVANIFKKSKVLQMQVPLVVIHEGLSDLEALMIEAAFIKAIGREIDGGPLANITEGGDSYGGVSLAESTKEKIRQAHIGLKASSETRLKMSLLRKGHPSSENSLKNLAKAHSPSARKKAAASIRANGFWTPERRAIQGQRMRDLRAKQKENVHVNA